MRCSVAQVTLAVDSRPVISTLARTSSHTVTLLNSVQQRGRWYNAEHSEARVNRNRSGLVKAKGEGVLNPQTPTPKKGLVDP